MDFFDKHKALIITVLFCSVLILGLYNFNLSQKQKYQQEMLVDLEEYTQTEEEEEIPEEPEEETPETYAFAPEETLSYMVDASATAETVALFYNLKSVSDNHFIVGQQDAFSSFFDGNDGFSVFFVFLDFGKGPQWFFGF